ncbi:sulfite reductase [NADPH] flavoprotein component [Entomophthora muscae]|uniref:Sulfite reductase [NADPH] flavoprotein component n=1 Tax=Entomophthora muscae TaxID=34485 RepID=A0ACC2SQK5_9FUNG|nr:sulfite reductase [NADPH] flavoprotein component [Entomophthora muscae]
MMGCSVADSGWFDSAEGSPRVVTPKERGLDLLREELGVGYTSGNAAVGYVAGRFSDVLFDYALLHRSKGIDKLNVFGRPVVVKEHLTVAGSGESLRGCLELGKCVGGLMSCDSFLDVALLLGEESGVLVMHVSSERYGDDGVVSDYSAIQSGLDSGATCLVSYSVQESYDIAVAGHLLAIATKRPVLHVYDGIAVGNVSSPHVELREFSSLVPYVEGKDLDGVFKVMAEVGSFPKYASVEVCDFRNIVSALPSSGGIRLRQLRPFPAEAFLKALNGNDESVVVVEPIVQGRGLIYGEILKWGHAIKQRITRQLPQHKQEACIAVWGTGDLVGKTLASILQAQCHTQVDTLFPQPIFKEQIPFSTNIVAIQDSSILKYLLIPKPYDILLVNATQSEDISQFLPGKVFCIDAVSVAREWSSEDEAALVFLAALSLCHPKLKHALSKTSLQEDSLKSLLTLVQAKLFEITPTQSPAIHPNIPFRGHGLDLPTARTIVAPTPDSIVKWQRIFKLDSNPSPRPDLHDCHLIHVTKNVRLTPPHYTRNVFHLEFNSHNLSYAIGDALGVFGINNPDRVRNLLDKLEINPTTTLQLPNSTQSKHFIVTAKQLFSQFLDIFGRPNKDFYRFLAKNANDKAQAEELLFLASPEGSSQFQKRAQDTTTYADLLLEFHSARPHLQLLVDAIPRIQPRHYSIASSMSLHPSSVHLLVVHVNWTNSRGYQAGQCTDYLASLSPGDSVLVQIKPSLMTLPQDPHAPIVMAGLGTGMAPFRAFIQERYAQAKQGISVGPSTLYFGSRHRASEYLYGEELDKYFATKSLTSLRLAFSRDQPNKIYIQTLMQQDLEQLQHHLLHRKGSFYLCGPTWPEKDVRHALIQALSYNHLMSEADALNYLHQMKEEGRYILELY